MHILWVVSTALFLSYTGFQSGSEINDTDPQLPIALAIHSPNGDVT